jgi:hypothetical protein
MGRRAGTILVVFALTVVSLAVGCSRPQPEAPTMKEPVGADRPTLSPGSLPSPRSTAVAIETTSVVPTDRHWWPGGLKVVPEPARGDRIMWVRETVKNSGDATGWVTLGNSYPVLTDTAGQTRPLLYPRISAPKATAIGPGRSVALIMLYDVPSERQSYTMTWHFYGGAGSSTFLSP